MRIIQVPLEQRLDATWPKPAEAAAWTGLAGEFSDAVDPFTEADKHAVLLNTLVMAGNVVGRSAHFQVGATQHRANLNAVTAGSTGTGRKGTASGEAFTVFDGIDPKWASPRNGLSTGEGVIDKVRDAPPRPGSTKNKGKPAPEPPPADKRLLVLEPEFGRVLRVVERVGNNLVPVLNTAWDSTHALHLMTRNAPLTATGYHISIIGHITFDELDARLQREDIFNGFANRFLWACVRRSKTLPIPPEMPARLRMQFRSRMEKAVASAQTRGRVTFEPKAEALWRDSLYADLTKERVGTFGAATDRAAPQVIRLALIYALLDRSRVIKRCHLQAANAIWDYCEASARHIFGRKVGGPHRDVDTILQALRSAGATGISRTKIIHDVLQGHRTRDEVTPQLEYLQKYGFVTMKIFATKGRPKQRWYAL